MGSALWTTHARPQSGRRCATAPKFAVSLTSRGSAAHSATAVIVTLILASVLLLPTPTGLLSREAVQRSVRTFGPQAPPISEDVQRSSCVLVRMNAPHSSEKKK